jgi:hypothetical protein
MRREYPNREYLLIVADAIGDLCNEIVLVGGSVAGLLLTDAVADGVRATKDVDAVVEATTLSQYHQAEKKLAVSGFDRIEIRVISGPAFVATKLEAFMSRGGGDILSSHDLEDILNVVDGRPSIVEELSAASEALQKFVRQTFGALLARPDLENYLPGLLSDGNRTAVVLSRLKMMAA